jgi:hypothetical protein
MNKPSDIKLYNRVKKQTMKKIPKHSAYRSGIIVKTYKKKFTEKYGLKKRPYTGSKTKKKGLGRWFKEKWVNQRGEVGYKYKNDIYRPSKRITKKTPVTHKELSKKEIKRARTKKYKKGRVNRFKKGGTRKNKTSKKPKKRNGAIYFSDYPDFRPNLTPSDIFNLGSFGGTYWRPIKSTFFKSELKNQHKKYPKSWWEGIPEENLSSKECDIKKNKYGVRVGTSLKFWENKKWMRKSHPYGWVQWYCDFYLGKRSEDDERQIKRWLGLAGKKGRFRNYLITLIKRKRGDYNDYDISPKIRQTLQQWGYKLTKKDFNI